MAWTIIEIETAAPGWRTQGSRDDGSPVSVWALVENEAGERFVVGLDATAEGTAGSARRMLDVNRMIADIPDDAGGYIYRAPLS